MSLVNQMLKDLETRRARLPQGDRLRGLHAAPAAAAPRHSRWPLIMLLAGTSGGAFGWWLSQPAAPAPPLAVPMALAEPDDRRAPEPAAAQPTVMVETHEIIVAGPADTAEPVVALAALETHPHAEPPEPEAASTATDTNPEPASRPQPAPVADAPAPAGRMHKTARPLEPQQQAARHYADALQALRDGDPQRAEAELRAALEIRPGHGDSAQTLATLLVQQGRNGEAETLLDQALNVDARQPALRALQARLLAENGRDAEAVALLQGSADPEALALLGALQQRLGDHAAAAAAYRQALQRAPQRGAWWLGLAISLEHGREPAAALQAYRRALADAALDTQVNDYVRGRIAALGNGQG
jgi:Tfp pilus assembly protein PilF